MWEPCLFRGRPPVPLKKGCKRGYLVSHRKRLEPRVLPWQQYGRCHFVSYVMYISGAKFEDHCSDISGDILNSVFYCFKRPSHGKLLSLKVGNLVLENFEKLTNSFLHTSNSYQKTNTVICNMAVF